ncbi:retrovirus-related pol polyprotein from transposon TNT 1-94 [Tanacetum coccineum]
MHNEIMAAGSKERPPMLALETPEDGNRPRVPGYIEKETYANTNPDNRKLIDAKAEARAVHMILNVIRNDIYSTIDGFLGKGETTPVIQIIIFIVDSGCTKHMTGNLKLLCNLFEKYLGTVRFMNDQFAPVLGYKDLVQGNVTIKRGNDLLTGTRGSDHFMIALQESSSPTLICFMEKASPTQAWLWHRCLSHLNFDTINLLSNNDIVNGLPKLKYVKDQLISSCEMGKAKRSTFNTKTTPNSKGQLYLLHMDLCGPMWVKSINGKKYIMVIVDDYPRYTLTHFLRSMDETPEVLIDILNMIQRSLQAQNGVFERRNRTLVEAARTMLSTSKLPLFFSAEAIATAFRDGENLDKMKEKRDPCIFFGVELRIQDHSSEPSSSKMVPNVVPLVDKTNTSPQELELLFSPMYEEYFNAGNQIVSNSSGISDNLQQQDTQPTLNVQTTLEPIIPPKNFNAKENNIE